MMQSQNLDVLIRGLLIICARLRSKCTIKDLHRTGIKRATRHMLAGDVVLL